MKSAHIPKKYYCYLKTERTKKRDEAVLLNYIKVTFVEDYQTLLKCLKEGDTAIFYDVLELDRDGTKDYSEIVNYYKEIMNTGAELMFEKSTSCDSGVISVAVNDFADKGILKGTKESAFQAILELQIQTYILALETTSEMKRTANVVASKVDGKHLGRPAGSRSESDKAKKNKDYILKESVDFNGKMAVGVVIKNLGISRQTYYNYKKQLLDNGGKNI